MRNAFVARLHGLAREDPRVILLTADNGAIVFDRFREELPDQFVNCGICEATMMSVAAGLAAEGAVPFVYTITPFLIMRAFEQVRNDVCMQGMNVKIVGIGGGLRYSTLGPTHHAVEDIALMRVLPGMKIFSPADPAETARAVAAMKETPGPVYLRMGTTREGPVYRDDAAAFEPGRGVILREGGDAAILGTGSILRDCLRAAADLADEGLDVQVVNIHTLKPLDADLILRTARRTGTVVTVEEHSVIGGLGEGVAAVLAGAGIDGLRFRRIGIEDTFCHGYGDHAYLKERHGLSAAAIASAVRAAKSGTTDKERS